MTGIEAPTSKISGGPVVPVFRANVLGKHNVQYYRCTDTGFIQTETPYWLEEAYSSAISALDVGYVSRNFWMSTCTEKIIERCFAKEGHFLDYGGGYGMFVRLMRDKGLDFVRYDPHCQNLFAIYFDAPEQALNTLSFELVTAFEVFEHLPEPLVELERMFRASNSILFSTELQPDEPLNSVNDWWYFVPEAGQHVSFYTLEALHRMASSFDAKLYSNGKNLHLMTKRCDVKDPFAPEFAPASAPTLFEKAADRWLRPSKNQKPLQPAAATNTSLLDSDFQQVLAKIRTSQE